MAGRIRSLKPEWLDDERLSSLHSDARVMSVALILLADDYGRGRASEAYLAGQVFAGAQGGPGKARESLARLSGWYVDTYEIDEQRYFSIRNWEKHQRVDHPGKPRVPAPLQEFARVSRESRENAESLAPDLRPPTRTTTSDQDHDHDRSSELFAQFWEAYPKKVGKGNALKVWKRNKPPLADCLGALAWQTTSRQWTIDGGRFIPNPATYLGQERWVDERPPENNGPKNKAEELIQSNVDISMRWLEKQEAK